MDAGPPPENPYRPPSTSTAPESAPLTAPIQYDAAATVEDLRRALRVGHGMVWDAVTLTLFGIAFLMLLLLNVAVRINGPRVQPPLATLDIALLLVGFVILVAARGFYQKLFVAERYLKKHPRALQHLTGELNPEGLFLRGPEGRSWWPHRSLLMCQHQQDQIIISYDMRGASKQILPERGFSDPGAALQCLLQHAQHNTKPALGGLDQRLLEPLTDPIMIGDQPPDAIPFQGTIRSRDLDSTPLGSIRRRSLKKVVASLVAAHIFAVVLFLWFGFLVALCLFVPLLFVDYLALLVYRRTLRPLSNPEAPLMLVRGWLNAQGIAILANVEQSVTHWDRFDRIGTAREACWAHFEGPDQLYLLFPRRFFDSDSDWEAAQRIFRSTAKHHEHQQD